MEITAQVKLLPSEEQAEILLQTLERANAACNYISEYAYENETHSKYKLQKAIYYDVRERFDLSAQMGVRALGKVADAYTTNPDARNEFRPRGGFPYDSRLLRYFTKREEVSIWTLGGRERIPYVVGDHHRKLLAYQQGESDLLYRNGMFFLLATCDVPEEDEQAIDGYLGVDLGIANIASDSDGEQHSGKQIDDRREWYEKRRRILQAVGTRSAKRRLRWLSGKQERFQRDTNHRIAKRIVEKAKGTHRGIALEDLSGIRERTTVRHEQRSRHSNWGFHQLRQFIEYKARLTGVPVKTVDAAYTSRTCSACGHCEKANRPSQSEFVCRSCGHAMNADGNAALNIAARASVNEPMVASEALGPPSGRRAVA